MTDPAARRPNKSTNVRSQIALTIVRARLRLAGFLLADGGAASATRLFATPRRFPRPPREVELLATAERFDVDALLDAPASPSWSTSVPAWRWGRGPTVLLVHGWEGRGAQLGELVAPLVAAGFSVVTFDAPAHGDAPGQRLYLADMASAIVAVSGAVGPLHAVVAHSFGALGTSLALARGLVAERAVYLGPASLVTGALARFAHILQLPRETVAAMEHALALANGFAPADTVPERVARGRATPLLIMHGDADDEVPVGESRRLAAAWHGSQLVIVPGLGHRRILRDAASIASAMRFLVDAAATNPGSRPASEDEGDVAGRSPAFTDAAAEAQPLRGAP